MNNREPGLDIYRIAAMLMITILHVNYQHLGVPGYSVRGVYAAGWLIEYFCFCGVNCFALLSGYLLGEQKWSYDRKWLERTAGLWVKLIVWGVLLYFAGISLKNPGRADWESFKINLCPPFGNWWYISAYFGVLTVLPVLNNFISAVKPAVLLRISLIFFFFFSILPTVMHSGGAMGLASGYSALWLIVCYIWGASLKSFMVRINNFKYIVPISAAMVLFCGLFPAFFHLFCGADNPELFMNYLSPLCVLQAVFLLILCLRITIRGKNVCRIVTFISSNSLGIYLFQCHLQIWETFILRHDPPVLPASELLWRFPAMVLALGIAGIICNVLIEKIYSWCRFDKLIRRCCEW